MVRIGFIVISVFVFFSTLLFPNTVLAQDPNEKTDSLKDEAKQTVDTGEKISVEEAKILFENVKALTAKKEYGRAISICESLLDAYPNHVGYLFQLGRLYSWDGQWDRAIATLLRCIEIEQRHNDARLSLGTIYMWKGELQTARKYFKEIVARDPSYWDAYTALARVEMRLKNAKVARDILKLVIQHKPDDKDALRSLGLIEKRASKFKEAKSYFERVLEIAPQDTQVQGWLFDVKRFTNLSVEFKNAYSTEREEDQRTGKRVVESTLLNSSLTLQYPLSNRAILFGKASYSHQTEENVQAKRDNYDVEIQTLTLGGRMRVGDAWRLRAQVATKDTSRKGNMTFLFEDEFKVEPLVSVGYAQELFNVSLTANLDSFVAKDFVLGNSELLERKNLDAAFTFNGISHVRVGTNFTYRRINGTIHNTEKMHVLWVNTKVPYVKNFDVTYRFRYRIFKQDVPEYYSFDTQETHAVRIRYAKLFNDSTRFEASFIKTLNHTFETVNPNSVSSVTVVKLPNSVEVSTNGNKVTALFSKRFKDDARIELSGNYFWDSNNYEAFSLAISFLWQF